jgi:16S rRNA (uracil1498-N3)-methyltransferase
VTSDEVSLRARPRAWAASAEAVAHAFIDRLDDEARVTGADGHHLARVRRLGPGEGVTAADGRGAWRPYQVVATARGELALAATGRVREEPALAPRLGVAFALTKGVKPEAVVARLTELGVDEIVPVATARSQVRWRESHAEAAVARLERVAREAAMQCRRARLPEIAAATALSDIARRPGLVVADRSGGPADAVPEPPGGAWLVLVGPEGGLAPEELARLDPAPRLGVGPHALRADTAAPAAAAALAGRRMAPRAGEVTG